MVKIKKKVSVSHPIINSVIFILTISIIGYMLYVTHNEDLYNGTKINENIINKQYIQVMKRADYFTKMYQNTSGFPLPPCELEYTMLSQNRNDTILSLSVSSNNNDNNARNNNRNEKKFFSEKQSEEPELMNIVIGMAQDTDPKNLAVFCYSLREHTSKKDTKVVLFINSPIPIKHIEIAKSANVELIPFNTQIINSKINDRNSINIFNSKENTTNDIAINNGYVNNEYNKKNFLKYHPSSLRWNLIYNYLKNTKMRNKYRQVLLIDVRDSFFQNNPFLIIPKNVINVFYVFKGVETINIIDCGWNGGWVRDCFGDKILKEIGNNNIICSGVSIGTMDTVYEYLTLMDDILMNKKISLLSKLSNFPLCERNGVDQGVHNVLVHQKMIKNLRIFSQKDGQVGNMQSRVMKVNGRIVKNSIGEKVAVVHQYDRYPDLQKLLFSEYVHWVDTNDPAAEWKQESMCSKYDYKLNTDLFKGQCDLQMHGGATSFVSCCQYCNNLNNCKSFTYLSGTCHLKSCAHDSNKVSKRNVKVEGAVSGYLL